MEIMNDIKEVEIQGTKLKVREATLVDISTYSEFLKSKKRSEYINICKQIGEKVEAKEVLSIEVSEEEISSSQKDLSNILRLIHICTSHLNKELNYDEFLLKLKVEDIELIVGFLFPSVVVEEGEQVDPKK